MTGNQMIEKFGLLYGQEINAEVPGLESPEILSFLNTAKDALVEELYEKGDLVSLSSLLRTNDGLAGVGGYNNIQNSTVYSTSFLSDTFLYYVGSRSKITKTFPVISDEWIENDLIAFIRKEYIETPYNITMFKNNKVSQIIISGVVCFILLTDHYTTSISDFELEYIKKPSDITASSTEYTDVNLDLHPDIVKKAVTNALVVMKDERIKTQPAVNN